MKPRTKIEVAVHTLAQSLQGLTAKQEQYAIGKFFEKLCFRTKNTAFCLECGNDIDVATIVRKSVVCSHCGEKLKVRESRRRNHSSEMFDFAVASLVKTDAYDFQLVRNFEMQKHCRKGQKARIYISEYCQNWHEAKGKRVIYSKMINNGSYCGSLEVRKEGYYKDYLPTPDIFCPTSKFRAEYAKRGISSKMKRLSLERTLQKLHNPKIETLLKAGFYTVVNWNQQDIAIFWDALKICIRNKYKIPDGRSYIDMLVALEYLNKDLRNPVFVCPKNFKKSHDHWIKLRHEKKVGKERAKNLKTAQEYNPKYQEEKKDFLHLEFASGKIQIRPLQTVREFLDEGTELDHCVFKSGYYKNKDRLVLSARIGGKPIETIEVDLEKFEIVQCRGHKNNHTERHGEIMKLMKKNLPKIRKTVVKTHETV